MQEGGAADEWTGVLHILSNAVEPPEGEVGAVEAARFGVDKQAVVDLVAPAGLLDGQTIPEEAGDVSAPTASRGRYACSRLISSQWLRSLGMHHFCT